MELRIEPNRRAIASVLKLPTVRSDLERRARRVAAGAGPGHEVQLYQGRSRWRATVRTVTPTNRAGQLRLGSNIWLGR